MSAITHASTPVSSTRTVVVPFGAPSDDQINEALHAAGLRPTDGLASFGLDALRVAYRDGWIAAQFAARRNTSSSQPADVGAERIVAAEALHATMCRECRGQDLACPRIEEQYLYMADQALAKTRKSEQARTAVG